MSLELRAIVNSETLNSNVLVLYNNKEEILSELITENKNISGDSYPWTYPTGKKKEQRKLMTYTNETQQGRAIITNVLSGSIEEALQLIFKDIDEFYHTTYLQMKLSGFNTELLLEYGSLTKTKRIRNYFREYQKAIFTNDIGKTRSYLKPKSFLDKYKIRKALKTIPYLNYDNNDISNDKCFYNFINERYKRVGKKAKEKYNHTEGVSLQDVIAYTDKYKIKCMLFNIAGRCIYYNEHEQNKNHSNLYAIISNHHIYPLSKDRKVLKPEFNETKIYTENEELFDVENSEICNDIAYVKNDKTYTRDGCLLPYGLDSNQIDHTFFQELHPNFLYEHDIHHIKAFYYTNNELINNCNYEYDINNAYFNIANEIILNSDFDKCPLFTYDDIWHKFNNKEIDNFSYYTISKEALLKVNKYGISDNQRMGYMIKLLIDNKLLDLSDIEYEKEPSFLIKWSDFKKNVDKLVLKQIAVKLKKDVKELTEEDIENCGIKKDFVFYNGILGKVKNLNQEYIYNCDRDEYDLLNYGLPDDKELWEMREIENTETVYYKKHNKTIFRKLNNVSLYNMIVEMTNYVLLKNIIHIKNENNLMPIKINTDSICYDVEINLLDDYVKYFKLQTINDAINKQELKLKVKEIFKMKRDNEPNYNNIEEVLKNIIDSTKDKFNNICFTGAPGTGKTYTVKNNYDYHISCTNTNMCLLNMDEDSRTIFSLLELHHQDNYLSVLKKLSNKVIWVDEFSMINKYILNFFFIACYMYNAKIIWSGDINQISPIDGEKVDLNSTMTKILFGKITYLTKDWRNGKLLIKLREQVLNNNFKNVYKLSKSNNDWFKLKHHIVYTHKTKEYINTQMLKLKGYTYKICYDKNKVFTHKIISNGVILIVRKNKKKLNFLKNDRWEVIGRDEETHEYILKNIIRDITMRISYEDTKYFTLGFAFTSHSSQGLTITEKYAIHDIKKMLYVDKDIFYTALTRGKELKDISFYNTYRPKNFIYPIKEPNIKDNEKDIEYYNKNLITNKKKK